MQYKLRDSLVSVAKVSYAKEDEAESHESFSIDCSAGSNPFLMPDAAKKAVTQATIAQVNLYPHYSGLKKAICRSLSASASLSPKNLLLTAGSIDGISLVLTAFSRPGARTLGVCPQFSDYMSCSKLLGYEYLAAPLCTQNGLAFDKNAVLSRIDSSLSLVYIDNPNNPTGQMIPLGVLKEIALAAREHGACLIIDEAYGDYMPEENFAAPLIGELDNVIVLRTFSKGWGLAGLRAGYVIASEEMIGVLSKLSNPYVISEPARIVCEAALSDPLFLQGCRQSIAARKAALRKALCGKLSMAKTEDAVPICLLIHEDPGCDLQKVFASHGVSVVSGSDFLSLSGNSVRLRLPDPAQFDELLDIVRTIDRC